MSHSVDKNYASLSSRTLYSLDVLTLVLFGKKIHFVELCTIGLTTLFGSGDPNKVQYSFFPLLQVSPDLAIIFQN